MRILIRTLWFVLILFQACASSRWVQPFQKGEVAVSANLGGQFIILGDIPLFIPITSVAAGYGGSEQFNGGVHTTALAFGVIQADLGAIYAPLSPKKLQPGFSGFYGLNPMMDVWDGNFRCYPQLDLNAWWTFGNQGRHLLYTGCSGWGEFLFFSCLRSRKSQHDCACNSGRCAVQKPEMVV